MCFSSPHLTSRKQDTMSSRDENVPPDSPEEEQPAPARTKISPRQRAIESSIILALLALIAWYLFSIPSGAADKRRIRTALHATNSAARVLRSYSNEEWIDLETFDLHAAKEDYLAQEG